MTRSEAVKALWQNPEYRAKQLANKNRVSGLRPFPKAELNLNYQTGEYSGLTKKEYARARKMGNRAYVQDLKTKNPCMDCGQYFPYCAMDFDHRDGAAKRQTVNYFMVFSRSTLLTEIAKCDLVCSNCHRIRTLSRIKALEATNDNA